MNKYIRKLSPKKNICQKTILVFVWNQNFRTLIHFYLEDVALGRQFLQGCVFVFLVLSRDKCCFYNNVSCGRTANGQMRSLVFQGALIKLHVSCLIYELQSHYLLADMDWPTRDDLCRRFRICNIKRSKFYFIN